jgi:hypothetical protein
MTESAPIIYLNCSFLNKGDTEKSFDPLPFRCYFEQRKYAAAKKELRIHDEKTQKMGRQMESLGFSLPLYLGVIKQRMEQWIELAHAFHDKYKDPYVDPTIRRCISAYESNLGYNEEDLTKFQDAYGVDPETKIKFNF